MTSDSPQGLCARCLLSAAAGTPSNVTIDSPSPRFTGSQPGPSYVAAVDIGDMAEVAKRLPQFDFIDLLGRGGMGVVYKARQVQLDRIVALKILPPGDAQAPGFIERFRREARSLAKLGHPNIVSVYDFGETNGLYYFVMEFVDGVTLRELILAHSMTAAEALAVIPKICDALQFAHEEGVVHRDIKPENILLDKKGRVKIADFGLAKLLQRSQSELTLGTIRYMAPEQLDKPDSVDHRADIYSLGVVFYELLTGEIPMGRFAKPSEKVQIDIRLDEIVLHALERDVHRRYQHASEVRDDVENVTRKPQAPPAVSAADPPGPAQQTPPQPVIALAPPEVSSSPGMVVMLLATLAAAWLGVYVFDQHVNAGDSILIVAGHLLIPLGAVAAVAWFIAPRAR
jgi:serine/threonine protein kinase